MDFPVEHLRLFIVACLQAGGRNLAGAGLAGRHHVPRIGDPVFDSANELRRSWVNAASRVMVQAANWVKSPEVCRRR